ncbi:hypothetical protein DL98DRAFT_591800 [Cadophora sp. DSE1049]|nr:hypothetical protein DL98DRAFT_591800 [Cadophora sp. DSE1049]
MAISPMDVPYMVNPPQIAFRQPPVFPGPPHNPYPRLNAAFGPRVELLLSPPNQYTSFPRYPLDSDTDSDVGSQEPSNKTTIHHNIAERLLRDPPHGVTRTGIAALIEGYNSRAHPRDVIKIKHPTDADNNIEAAIMRIEILQRALTGAVELHDDLKNAFRKEDDEQIREQGFAKLERASDILERAETLSELLENWLIRELQSNEAGDSTQDFAEIGQKAKEIEDSWIGQIRQILSQAWQMSENKVATYVDTDGAQETKKTPFSLKSVQMNLLDYIGRKIGTSPSRLVCDDLRTALEVVVAYPEAGLNTSTRRFMENNTKEDESQKLRTMDDFLVLTIARYLIEISILKVEIDDTVVEYSRRAIARMRCAETERDVALRTMMEKEVQFKDCWVILLRPCNAGYGETLKTWVSNTTDLINGVDGAQEKFEAQLQPLGDSPDWAEVYAASLLYDYGRLVL